MHDFVFCVLSLFLGKIMQNTKVCIYSSCIWLISCFQVERSMKESLQTVLNDACSAYRKTKRTEWVQSWPGQIILAGSAIHWTAEVTKVRPTSVMILVYLFLLC